MWVASARMEICTVHLQSNTTKMRCQILLTAWVEVLRQSPVDSHPKDVRYCSLNRYRKDEMPNPNVYGAFLTRLQGLKVCFFPFKYQLLHCCFQGKRASANTHTHSDTHTETYQNKTHQLLARKLTGMGILESSLPMQFFMTLQRFKLMLGFSVIHFLRFRRCPTSVQLVLTVLTAVSVAADEDLGTLILSWLPWRLWSRFPEPCRWGNKPKTWHTQHQLFLDLFSQFSLIHQTKSSLKASPNCALNGCSTSYSSHWQ